MNSLPRQRWRHKLERLKDQEVVFAIRFYEIVLSDQPVSRLPSFLDHDVPAYAVILAIAIAIDDAEPRFGRSALCKFFSSATGSATSW